MEVDSFKYRHRLYLTALDETRPRDGLRRRRVNSGASVGGGMVGGPGRGGLGDQWKLSVKIHTPSSTKRRPSNRYDFLVVDYRMWSSSREVDFFRGVQYAMEFFLNG